MSRFVLVLPSLLLCGTHGPTCFQLGEKGVGRGEDTEMIRNAKPSPGVVLGAVCICTLGSHKFESVCVCVSVRVIYPIRCQDWHTDNLERPKSPKCNSPCLRNSGPAHSEEFSTLLLSLRMALRDKTLWGNLAKLNRNFINICNGVHSKYVDTTPKVLL